MKKLFKKYSNQTLAVLAVAVMVGVVGFAWPGLSLPGASPAAITVTKTITEPVLTYPYVKADVEAIPVEVQRYADDWPMYGKDYGNTRATTTSSINSSNVSTLAEAWTIPLVGGATAISTNPVIIGDTVLFQDRNYTVYSADFNTGELNWVREYNTPWIGPNGVAVGYGKVFAPLDWYHIGALDINTGEELWKTTVSSTTATNYLYINIAPVVYDGEVYAATAPHVAYSDSGGLVGWIYAFDQETGAMDWAFNTILSDDLWGHPDVNSGGGCWQPCSIDVNTGMTFWGIANPGNSKASGRAYSGAVEGNVLYENAGSRPGPNLYTNSVVALDSRTGKLEWFNQAFPHDIYDHDLMNPPVLASANIMGKDRDLVLGSGKGGEVFCYDRYGGQTVWSTPVGMHQYDHEAYLPDDPTLEVYPGVLGGVETPMAYYDGVVYAAYDDLWTTYTSTGLASVQSIGDGTGGLAAIDVATGEIKWDVKLPSLALGGATVVNDLVFTATYSDNMIRAFNKDTGASVFTYKAPAGINGWPAVAGDTIIWPCGVSANPVVLALRLGATPPTTTTTPTTTTMPTTSPTTTVMPTTTTTTTMPTGMPTTTAAPNTFASLANQGKSIYSNICSVCHGASGGGTDVGPALWGSGATLGTYGGSTLFDRNAQAMLDFISSKMPLTNPGGLTMTQYNEVLCYILVTGNYVAGSTPFTNLSSVTF